MIVFLDVSTKKVKLYTEQGMQVIPFDKAQLLQQIIGNNEVLYVTNAVKTTGNEVFKTVIKLAAQNISSSKQTYGNSKVVAKPSKSEPMFIRSKKSNIIIQDIGLTLPGPNEIDNCKPLKDIFAKHGNNILKDHALLNKLIQQGVVELITLTEVQYYAKQQSEKQSIKDKQSDSILVNSGMSAQEVAENSSSGSSISDDAIEIDLNKGGFGGGGSGGGGGNEGGLLPDDFVP